jgi:hypothetical protein
MIDSKIIGITATVGLGLTVALTVGTIGAFASGNVMLASKLYKGTLAVGGVTIATSSTMFLINKAQENSGALGELNFDILTNDLEEYNFKEIFEKNSTLRKYNILSTILFSKFNVKDNEGNIVKTHVVCYHRSIDENKVYFFDKIQSPNGKVIYDVTDVDSDDLDIDVEELLIRIINNTNIKESFLIGSYKDDINDIEYKTKNLPIYKEYSGFNLLFNKPAIKGIKGHTGGKHSMLGNRRR